MKALRKKSGKGGIPERDSRKIIKRLSLKLLKELK
jgi:hypothetical protein